MTYRNHCTCFSTLRPCGWYLHSHECITPLCDSCDRVYSSEDSGLFWEWDCDRLTYVDPSEGYSPEDFTDLLNLQMADLLRLAAEVIADGVPLQDLVGCVVSAKEGVFLGSRDQVRDLFRERIMRRDLWTFTGYVPIDTARRRTVPASCLPRVAEGSLLVLLFLEGGCRVCVLPRAIEEWNEYIASLPPARDDYENDEPDFGSDEDDLYSDAYEGWNDYCGEEEEETCDEYLGCNDYCGEVEDWVSDEYCDSGVYCGE